MTDDRDPEDPAPDRRTAASRNTRFGVLATRPNLSSHLSVADTRSLSFSSTLKPKLPFPYEDQGPHGPGYLRRDGDEQDEHAAISTRAAIESRSSDPGHLSFAVSKVAITVFDGVLTGTGPDYGVPGIEDALGFGDDLAIVVVANQVTGVSTTLTVQLEHSGDRQSWVAKDTIPELNGAALSGTATTTLVVHEARRNASLGFVRLRLQLAATSGTPSARLTVRATCGWRRPVE